MQDLRQQDFIILLSFSSSVPSGKQVYDNVVGTGHLFSLYPPTLLEYLTGRVFYSLLWTELSAPQPQFLCRSLNPQCGGPWRRGLWGGVIKFQ